MQIYGRIREGIFTNFVHEFMYEIRTNFMIFCTKKLVMLQMAYTVTEFFNLSTLFYLALYVCKVSLILATND